MFKPFSEFRYWPFQGGASFVDPFCYLCFFIILSCLFLAALWSPAVKGLTSWLSCVWCFLVFLSLSHMVSQVSYGTWLYWFLIFAFFTFIISASSMSCRIVLTFFKLVPGQVSRNFQLVLKEINQVGQVRHGISTALVRSLSRNNVKGYSWTKLVKSNIKPKMNNKHLGPALLGCKFIFLLWFISAETKYLC